MASLTVVTVTLEDREDGGLRVFSDLPGLILSGPDQHTVVENIIPAIRALFKHNGQDVTVRAARPPHEFLRDPSPRAVEMHVKHKQFVVELAEAA